MVLDEYDMIGKARAEHLDEITRLWLKTNISAHSFIPKTYWESMVEQVKEALPASDLFIYRENAIIMGFIGITDNQYIAGLFVDEKFQSQGIGRKLLDYCKHRYSRLELDVFTENTGSVRFYQDNGFVITNTSADFGHEEHRMNWSA